MLSLCIITKNEEQHIGACLSRVNWVDEIILVDSGSTDRTVEIAKEYGAHIFTRPFDTFSKQKNYCIEQAHGDWILLLDADEFVESELKKEIQQITTNKETPTGHTINGYWIKRTVRWLGKPLRYGGLQNERVLRLIKRGHGHYEKDVHEQMCVDGPVGELQHAMLHDTTPQIDDYIRKHRHYLILDVRMRLQSHKTPSVLKAWCWPSLLFIRRYIFQLGFLDGLTGLRYQLAVAHFVWAKYTLTRRISLRRTLKIKRTSKRQDM